jgi:hypothetical protein
LGEAIREGGKVVATRLTVTLLVYKRKMRNSELENKKEVATSGTR